MSLDDFIRIFRCDGVTVYAVIFLLLFLVASEVTSRLRGWDKYFSRFSFLVFGVTGVLVGGGAYLLIHGSCDAPTI